MNEIAAVVVAIVWIVALLVGAAAAWHITLPARTGSSPPPPPKEQEPVPPPAAPPPEQPLAKLFAALGEQAKINEGLIQAHRESNAITRGMIDHVATLEQRLATAEATLAQIQQQQKDSDRRVH